MQCIACWWAACLLACLLAFACLCACFQIIFFYILYSATVCFGSPRCLCARYWTFPCLRNGAMNVPVTLCSAFPRWLRVMKFRIYIVWHPRGCSTHSSGRFNACQMEACMLELHCVLHLQGGSARIIGCLTFHVAAIKGIRTG